MYISKKRILHQGENIVFDDNIYIKNHVTGGLTPVVAGASGTTYKGEYNAATNTPDLDTAPSGVLLGDMYVVSAAGTFFTATVEIGDLLIANTLGATVEAEWDIIQANLTAATIKTQYESNANTNAYTDVDVLKVAAIIAAANTTEDLADAGAASVATHSSNFATGGAETATLAAGTEGQIKVFAFKTDGGNMVITVTNPAWGGGGTITFANAGEGCQLQYIDSLWFCTGNNGAIFA